jgi:hypothetical protein
VQVASGTDSKLDLVAREMAAGTMSRRRAIGALFSTVGAAWVLTPAGALAALGKRRCPRRRRCGDLCCGHGEKCRVRGGKHKCVCRKGLHRCKGNCVDLRTDPKNCGACGTKCPSDQVCAEGVCQPQCASGETLCDNNICTNIQVDNDNCGGCGNVCDDTQTCTDGVCTPVCSAIQFICGFTCCNPGEVCDNGTCKFIV